MFELTLSRVRVGDLRPGEVFYFSKTLLPCVFQQARSRYVQVAQCGDIYTPLYLDPDERVYVRKERIESLKFDF